MTLIRFTPEEKEIIHQIHLLSGKSKDETESFIMSYTLAIILECLDNKKVKLPFIGDLEIVYEKGSVEENQEPVVSGKIEFSKGFKKMIDNIMNNDETDVEKSFESEIKKILMKFV